MERGLIQGNGSASIVALSELSDQDLVNFGPRTSMSVSAMSFTTALATSSTTRMKFAPGTPGLTWTTTWTSAKSPSRTVLWRETGMFGPRDV